MAEDRRQRGKNSPRERKIHAISVQQVYEPNVLMGYRCMQIKNKTERKRKERQKENGHNFN